VRSATVLTVATSESVSVSPVSVQVRTSTTSIELSGNLVEAVGTAVSVRVAVGLAPADGLPEVSLSTNGTAGGLTSESGCLPSDPETRFPVTGRQRMSSTEDAEVVDPMTGPGGWRCGSHSGHRRSSRCCVSVGYQVQVQVTVDAAEPEVCLDCGRSCDSRRFHRLNILDEDVHFQVATQRSGCLAASKSGTWLT